MREQSSNSNWITGPAKRLQQAARKLAKDGQLLAGYRGRAYEAVGLGWRPGPLELVEAAMVFTR